MAKVRRVSERQIVVRLPRIRDKGQDQVSVPTRFWRGADDELQAAQEWSDRAVDVRKTLQAVPSTQMIDDAEQLGIITDRQADNLKDDHRDRSAGRQRPKTRLTIIEAALEHPDVKRADLTNGRDHSMHLRYLEQAVEHMGVAELARLTVRHVSTWVEHLKSIGRAWNTRRHALYYLRKACSIAPKHGIANPIETEKIDPKPRQAVDIQAFTIDQVQKAHRAFTDAGDWREIAALLLMALCGLRPSEVARLCCGSVKDGMLYIGIGDYAGEVKNESSRRVLALPAVVIHALEEIIDPDDLSRALIYPGHRGRGNGFFSLRTLQQWLAPKLREATNSNLSIKHLRKAFSTWAVSVGIETMKIEMYLGHMIHNLSIVTQRHYLVMAMAMEARPIADQVHQAYASGMTGWAFKRASSWPE